MQAQHVGDRLRELLAQSSPRPPLAEAALLLAVEEYPALDVSECLRQIAGYAAEVARVAGDTADPVARIAAIRRVVFEGSGFRGNREEYHDPRNSYLNEVLRRRLGIPISLSILVLGFGREINWPLYGVNFPGHFLVRYGDEPPYLAVDPFHGCLIIGEDELQERWRAVTGHDAPGTEQMLCAATPTAMLARLLNNLKSGYLSGGDIRRTAAVVEQMILIEPHQPWHYRDLGYLLLALDQRDRAVPALERYLAARPKAPDRDKILRCIDPTGDALSQPED